jgi:3-oxoacyl-[acyl-carrier protein] reductase
VYAVSPGPTETESTKEAGFAESPVGRELVRQTPLGRLGRPDDIAEIVEFLASDDARWVTGQIVQASGALSLG